MKKVILATCVFLTSISFSFSQRFAYVDMDYILSQVPAFEEAQNQLNNVSSDWQKQVESKMKEIDQLYNNFQAEQVLLTEQMKKQKIKEIEDKEKAVKQFQQQKFGSKGELFKKRQELIKPIQDDVYDEIQKMASVKGYDFVFDKSNALTMLYANERYDKSDDILKALGYK